MVNPLPFRYALYLYIKTRPERLKQQEEERAKRWEIWSYVLFLVMFCSFLFSSLQLLFSCCKLPSEEFMKEYESWSNKDKKAFLMKQWRAANK
jgi:hypothetical protein